MNVTEVNSEAVANEDRMDWEPVAQDPISKLAQDKLDQPAPKHRKLDPECVTNPPPELSSKVTEIANASGIKRAREEPIDQPTPKRCKLDPESIKNSLDFPNVMQEAITVARTFERVQMGKFNSLEQKAYGHQKTIHTLLDLSANLNTLNLNGKTLPEETKELFSKLREEGIDLWKEDKLPTEKQREELKTQIKSHTDQLRTKITMTLNDMNVVIQGMTSVGETVKSMLQMYARQLMATLTRNQRPGA